MMNKLIPMRGRKIKNYINDSYDDLMSDFHNMHKKFLSAFDEFFDSDSFPRELSKYHRFANNYNIEKLSEDKYKISINVAGYKKEDIEILLENDLLIIKGSMKNQSKDKYLYQGCSSQFYNQFKVEEGAEVSDASIENGILTITIKEPLLDKKHAKKIPIK